MKFAIAKEHREYFRLNQTLELENLLNINQLGQFKQGIQFALSRRLKLRPDQITNQQSSQLFRNGRDLWRSHDPIKKTICNPSYAEVFSELVDQKTIRLGYDQLFPAQQLGDGAFYTDFLQNPRYLSEFSCIQGVLGGLMLCIEGDATVASRSIFSATPGNGVFFGEDYLIEFEQMLPDHTYLLIVYTKKTSVYIANREDPFAHTLMNQGYSYGDRLTDQLNPVLCR